MPLSGHDGEIGGRETVKNTQQFVDQNNCAEVEVGVRLRQICNSCSSNAKTLVRVTFSLKTFATTTHTR